jgi:hypothetical protein
LKEPILSVLRDRSKDREEKELKEKRTKRRTHVRVFFINEILKGRTF